MLQEQQDVKTEDKVIFIGADDLIINGRVFIKDASLVHSGKVFINAQPLTHSGKVLFSNSATDITTRRAMMSQPGPVSINGTLYADETLTIDGDTVTFTSPNPDKPGIVITEQATSKRLSF